MRLCCERECVYVVRASAFMLCGEILGEVEETLVLLACKFEREVDLRLCGRNSR